MKLKQLLEQLNKLAEGRPEVLEMEVVYDKDADGFGFFVEIPACFLAGKK